MKISAYFKIPKKVSLWLCYYKWSSQRPPDTVGVKFYFFWQISTLMIGAHSRHCIYGNICAQLYCYQSNLKCVTNGMPAAQENFEKFLIKNIKKFSVLFIVEFKGNNMPIEQRDARRYFRSKKFYFCRNQYFFLVYFWTELIKICTVWAHVAHQFLINVTFPSLTRHT